MKTPSGDPAGQARLTPARISAIVGFALIYILGSVFLLAKLEGETLSEVFSIPFSLVLGLLGLSAVNYSVRGWRWAYLSNQLRLNVPVWKNIIYYVSGFALASTPGKAGEAIRLWHLKRGHGADYVRTLPLMVLDRLFDAYAVIGLSIISIAGFSEYRWQTGLIAAGVLGVSLPFLFPKRLHIVAGWCANHVRALQKFVNIFTPSLETLSSLTNWRIYAMSLATGLIGWLAECAALYFILLHFGAEVTFMNAIFAFSFSMLIGAISFLPGGLGTAEATMIIILRTMDVDFPTAIAATAIVRLTTFWFAVVLGFIATPFALNRSGTNTNAAKGNAL